jgi:hypothetical protein
MAYVSKISPTLVPNYRFVKKSTNYQGQPDFEALMARIHQHIEIM